MRRTRNERMVGRIGAGDGSRTRDLKFGKLVLYQLSYTRVWPILGADLPPINWRRSGYRPSAVYCRPLAFPADVFRGSEIRFT